MSLYQGKVNFMRYIGYHENKSRGTFGFPIQLYYVDSSHPQYEMPFHWHMECELILVLGGKFHLSITDIALSCGFNDLSYFNRLFKRNKGVTPSNYRKKFKTRL